MIIPVILVLELNASGLFANSEDLRNILLCIIESMKNYSKKNIIKEPGIFWILNSGIPR